MWIEDLDGVPIALHKQTGRSSFSAYGGARVTPLTARTYPRFCTGAVPWFRLLAGAQNGIFYCVGIVWRMRGEVRKRETPVPGHHGYECGLRDRSVDFVRS